MIRAAAFTGYILQSYPLYLSLMLLTCRVKPRDAEQPIRKRLFGRDERRCFSLRFGSRLESLLPTSRPWVIAIRWVSRGVIEYRWLINKAVLSRRSTTILRLYAATDKRPIQTIKLHYGYDIAHFLSTTRESIWTHHRKTFMYIMCALYETLKDFIGVLIRRDYIILLTTFRTRW